MRNLAVTTAVAGATGAALALALVPTGVAGAAEYSLDRRIGDSQVRESSGLARSTFKRPLLWTHNDSGDGPRLFAINRKGGTRAVVSVQNASANDWEDISSGPNHTLWIGDIGDNGRRRSHITVYRVKEPRNPEVKSVRATRFDLDYPDGAHDAEGLMVNPRTGRVFVVSKASGNGAIYRAPKVLRSGRINKLTRVTGAPDIVTAAAFSPNGRRIVIGTYTSAYVYSKMGGKARRLSKPKTSQGESLTVSRSGRSIFVGSEGYDSPVYRMPMPR
jgi:hypothetical protein